MSNLNIGSINANANGRNGLLARLAASLAPLLSYLRVKIIYFFVFDNMHRFSIVEYDVKNE